MTPDQMAELAARLHDFGKAYPVEIFPEITDAERAEHSGLITRAAAQMGRHFAKFAVPAADLIESMVQRVPLTDERLREIHHLDQFGLFCDYAEFEQIARAIEEEHGIRSEK